MLDSFVLVTLIISPNWRNWNSSSGLPLLLWLTITGGVLVGPGDGVFGSVLSSTGEDGNPSSFSTVGCIFIFGSVEISLCPF